MATTSSGADPAMVNKIASHLKSQGIFDQFRRDCLEDVDTKPAYQNLRQKVESYVSAFLAKVTWDPKMNKNQLRDSLRRQINQSEMLSAGVERIIEQVIEPKMQHVFRPQIEKVVDEFLRPEASKDEDSVKDLASTSGWQGPSHQTTLPAPPDLPPGGPIPAPPLPPSEPPAAPPEAPPEAPPDSPPVEPEIPPASHQDSQKVLHPGTSPTVSSGGSTPSAANKGQETPSLLKKLSGGLPPMISDVKAEKKLVVEPSSEGVNKSAGPSKPLVVKSEPIKTQAGKSLPGKDQGVKKVVGSQLAKTQPAKVVKKLAPGPKTADSAKATDKPKAGVPSKPAVLKTKTPPVEIKKEGQCAKPSDKDTDDVPVTQVVVKKPQQDLDAKAPSLELERDKKPTPEQKPTPDQLPSGKVSSEAKPEAKLNLKETEPLVKDTQLPREELRSISPPSVPSTSALLKGDTNPDPSRDQEIAESDIVEMASKGEESDGESGLSDISVSSVHTSDLSSFDEDISSTSSSSSTDSSSEEETKPKHFILKMKKPTADVYPSDSDSEVPSEVTISTDTSRPASAASAASDKPSARRSPRAQTTSTRALAISRYHGDSEDEDSRLERRKKAALAKEERARRRQLAKEEREKAILESREKRAVDSETAEESSEAKKVMRREEMVPASPLKATKEQLKEQKMLEKKREVRRRRSLNKRYFSDEFSSSMQGLKETVSQQEDDDEAPPEQVQQTEMVPLRAFIRKEKLQCFHLVYRELREPQVKCHHLLTQGLDGEQQRKLSTRKRKERRDSKVSRFSFPQTKATPGTPGEGSSKQSSTAQSADRKQDESEQRQEQQDQLQQCDEPQQKQQPKDLKEESPGREGTEQPLREGETQPQPGEETLTEKAESAAESSKEHPLSEDIPSSVQEPPQEQQPSQDISSSIHKSPKEHELPEDVLPSEPEQNHPSVKEQEKSSKEMLRRETEFEEKVEDGEKFEEVREENLPQVGSSPETFEKQEEEETEEALAKEQEEQTKESSREKQQQDTTEGQEFQSHQQDLPLEAEKLPEKVQTQGVPNEEAVKEDHQNHETVQQGVADVLKEDSQHRAVEGTEAHAPDELPVSDITTIEQAALPQELETVKDNQPTVSAGVSVGRAEDDIDNPPTPTQDEPSIYSDADSESEEHSDKGSSIPIYTVHSPKRLPLGSVFKLSQTSLHDMKPIGSGRTESRTLSKDSGASGPDDSEDAEKVSLQGDRTFHDESHKSSIAHDKQGPETKSPRPELPDKPSTGENPESSQPDSRYGTRPKRHAISPRDSLDDDYYYYGQPKRGRYTQSPVSPHEESGKTGRASTRRASTDSGKSEGAGQEATERPTRPSRQRHVSPPRRYSPSDTRSSHRRPSASSPHSPATPTPTVKQTRRGSSPSSHEHFTRRSSGREEAKRGNRYSDMYYYNDRGSRNQASTRGGDRGRAPEPVSSRRSSRRSLDDRGGNQPPAKRRK